MSRLNLFRRKRASVDIRDGNGEKSQYVSQKSNRLKRTFHHPRTTDVYYDETQ